MQNSPVQDAFSILLALSVTISSPILALNLVFKSPLPIPSGLFDIHDDMPQNVVRGPSPTDSERTYKASHEYKRSISPSVTVVEGRRSGDVWLSKGDAVDGKLVFFFPATHATWTYHHLQNQSRSRCAHDEQDTQTISASNRHQ